MTSFKTNPSIACAELTSNKRRQIPKFIRETDPTQPQVGKIPLQLAKTKNEGPILLVATHRQSTLVSLPLSHVHITRVLHSKIQDSTPTCQHPQHIPGVFKYTAKRSDIFRAIDAETTHADKVGAD